MDFNGFKKHRDGKDHTIFRHTDGHELKVMHKSVNNTERQLLQSLPKFDEKNSNHKLHPGSGYAEGGEVKKEESPEERRKNIENGFNNALGFGKKQPQPQPQQRVAKYADGTPSGVQEEDASPSFEDQLAVASGYRGPDVAPESLPGQITHLPEGQNVLSAMEEGASAQGPANQVQPKTSPQAPEYEQLLKQGQQEQLQGLDTAEAAIQGQRDAGAISGKTAKQLEALQDPAEVHNRELISLQQENDGLAQAIGEGKVDQNRLFANMSTGQRITNAIGLLLGGFAGPNNPAMRMLDQEVDRDVREQEQQIGRKKTLLEANLQKYKNLEQAKAATKLNLLKVADLKMAQAQSRTQSRVMQGQIQQQRGVLQQQMAGQMAQLASKKALDFLLNGSGQGAHNIDPATLVPQLVPEKHQAQVFKEIESAQNVAKNKSKMIQLFDQAANDETVVKRLGGLRGEAATKKALEGLMVSQIPIVDQTVRQYAAEAAFNSFLPARGDTSATIAVKRKGFQDWMNSNAKGTTAKGFGLDFDKFGSTKQQDVPAIKHKAPKI